MDRTCPMAYALRRPSNPSDGGAAPSTPRGEASGSLDGARGGAVHVLRPAGGPPTYRDSIASARPGSAASSARAATHPVEVMGDVIRGSGSGHPAPAPGALRESFGIHAVESRRRIVPPSVAASEAAHFAPPEADLGPHYREASGVLAIPPRRRLPEPEGKPTTPFDRAIAAQLRFFQPAESAGVLGKTSTHSAARRLDSHGVTMTFLPVEDGARERPHSARVSPARRTDLAAILAQQPPAEIAGLPSSVSEARRAAAGGATKGRGRFGPLMNTSRGVAIALHADASRAVADAAVAAVAAVTGPSTTSTIAKIAEDDGSSHGFAGGAKGRRGPLYHRRELIGGRAADLIGVGPRYDDLSDATEARGVPSTPVSSAREAHGPRPATASGALGARSAGVETFSSAAERAPRLKRAEYVERALRGDAGSAFDHGATPDWRTATHAAFDCHEAPVPPPAVAGHRGKRILQHVASASPYKPTSIY